MEAMDFIVTIVCGFGVICALVTIYLNAKFVLQIVMKKSKRVEEMTLFYYRFVLDICYGLILLLYIVFVLLSIRYQDFMDPFRPLIIYMALPWSNTGATRSIIAVFIAMERVLIVFSPVKYQLIRPRFPNWLILLIAITFGLTEWPVLFTFCDYEMYIPPACRVFGCAINRCFYDYWTGHKTIIFSAITTLSLFLSVKLFLWNSFKQSHQKLSRANRLALLDTLLVVIFDFMPAFLGYEFPTLPIFNFTLVGPYIPISKVVGCAIEAVVTCAILLPKGKKNSVMFPKKSSSWWHSRSTTEGKKSIRG